MVHRNSRAVALAFALVHQRGSGCNGVGVGERAPGNGVPPLASDAGLPGRGFRPGPRVVVAELGPQAGIVGAADLVRQAVAEGVA